MGDLNPSSKGVLSRVCFGDPKGNSNQQILEFCDRRDCRMGKGEQVGVKE
jgi:hypothetical protein